MTTLEKMRALDWLASKAHVTAGVLHDYEVEMQTGKDPSADELAAIGERRLFLGRCREIVEGLEGSILRDLEIEIGLVAKA